MRSRPWEGAGPHPCYLRSRTDTTLNSGDARMSFSQNRAVTHFSPENNRVWSLKWGEFGFEDCEYVSSVRATGQRLPSQPTAWMWLEPVVTSV